MLKQRYGLLEKIRAMEQAHNAKPVTSQQLEESLKNHHGELVVQTIEVVAPILFQMTLTIFSTDDPIGFITSDAPAAMYNPRAHTFPPIYRSPGLFQKDIELTLPLSPRHLALFSHKPIPTLYTMLSISAVDEVNRTTLFFCEKEIVSHTGAQKESWFSGRKEPADAWKSKIPLPPNEIPRQ